MIHATFCLVRIKNSKFINRYDTTIALRIAAISNFHRYTLPNWKRMDRNLNGLNSLKSYIGLKTNTSGYL